MSSRGKLGKLLTETVKSDFLTLYVIKDNAFDFPVPLYGDFWALVSYLYVSSFPLEWVDKKSKLSNQYERTEEEISLEYYFVECKVWIPLVSQNR